MTRRATPEDHADHDRDLRKNDPTTSSDIASEIATMIRRIPLGECSYCDKWGDDPTMPRHTASGRCESGQRNHCTCDTCF
jgi:hypothetical protein